MLLGLGDIARLNGSQSQEIVSLCVFRVNLDDGLEVFETFSGFSLHEVSSPSEFEGLGVGGVLLE